MSDKLNKLSLLSPSSKELLVDHIRHIASTCFDTIFLEEGSVQWLLSAEETDGLLAHYAEKGIEFASNELQHLLDNFEPEDWKGDRESLEQEIAHYLESWFHHLEQLPEVLEDVDLWTDELQEAFEDLLDEADNEMSRTMDERLNDFEDELSDTMNMKPRQAMDTVRILLQGMKNSGQGRGAWLAHLEQTLQHMDKDDIFTDVDE